MGRRLMDYSAPTLLFIDLETSGFYRKDLDIDDPGQPWAVSCAAALCNDAGTMTNFMSHIIRSEGRMIKENAMAVHGISDRVAQRIGVPESRVLGMLSDMLKTAPHMRVISYGDFDPMVISSLFSRFAVASNKPSSTYDRLWMTRPSTEFINLMTPFCQEICRLPSEFENGEYKWPSLDESAGAILGRPPRDGTHDAWQDMLLMRDIYFELAKRGLFPRALAEDAA